MSTNVEMRVTLPHALNDLLQLAGAIGSVCNGVSRIFRNSFMDKYSFRLVYFALLVVQITVGASIYDISD